MDKLVAPWKPACDFHYERVRVAIHHGSRKRRCDMAGEHGLTGQLLKAEEESVGDETSLCSFENTRREADTTTFAVFYMKRGLLVGAPPRFEREAP